MYYILQQVNFVDTLKICRLVVLKAMINDEQLFIKFSIGRSASRNQWTSEPDAPFPFLVHIIVLT